MVHTTRMSACFTGRVQGNTIVLDEAVPPLDGQRVRVIVEAVESVDVSMAEQRLAWQAWLDHGPQGPLDEEDNEWP